MKTTRSISILPIGFLLLVMAASCKRTSRIAILQIYPGNALIEALHNNDEQLMEYMPELKEVLTQYVNTAEKTEALKNFTAALIRKIATEDPDFYNDFMAGINSGDIEKADKALQKGMNRLATEIKAYGDDGQLTIQDLFDRIFKDYSTPPAQ